MKKFKSFMILLSVASCIIAAESHFHLLRSLSLNLSKDRYISFVSSMDYRSVNEKEPLTISDKAYDNTELSETDMERITAYTDLHRQLNEKYSLSEKASSEYDFGKVLRIMAFLRDHTFYNGMQMTMLRDNPIDILSYSVDKPFTKAINCRYKAIALADCLVSVGVKAYPVCLQSKNFGYCHFICHAYISEWDKWCAFDPSFSCFFTDKNGNLIDAFEMRDIFLSGEEPQVKEYSFNGTTEAFDVYLNSFIKCSLTNISTWDNNSPEGRDKKTFKGRKQFASKIPSLTIEKSSDN